LYSGGKLVDPGDRPRSVNTARRNCCESILRCDKRAFAVALLGAVAIVPGARATSLNVVSDVRRRGYTTRCRRPATARGERGRRRDLLDAGIRDAGTLTGQGPAGGAPDLTACAS
jgi:hypothetical protein